MRAGFQSPTQLFNQVWVQPFRLFRHSSHDFDATVAIPDTSAGTSCSAVMLFRNSVKVLVRNTSFWDTTFQELALGKNSLLLDEQIEKIWGILVLSSGFQSKAGCGFGFAIGKGKQVGWGFAKCEAQVPFNRYRYSGNAVTHMKWD